MDLHDKYAEEMDSVIFSDSFERDTVRLLRQAADDSAHSAKGDITMKKKKIFRIAAAAAALIMLLSGTVYAARALLTPSQVAERLGQKDIAAAFDSPGAVTVGESQPFGDYILTLEGIADGKALPFVPGETGGYVKEDRSYAVFSLTRADGRPMPDDCLYDDMPFVLSPIVNGIEPWRLSIFSLDASVMRMASDGTEYILMDTENIAIFADRGVRIAAYEGMSPGPEIFAVYPNGTTDFALGYDGQRAMFDLPIDPSKADPDAARELLDSLDEDFTDMALTFSQTEGYEDKAITTYDSLEINDDNFVPGTAYDDSDDIPVPDGRTATTTVTQPAP